MGVFGNLLGGVIADALARRLGYHGRPLSARGPKSMGSRKREAGVVKTATRVMIWTASGVIKVRNWGCVFFTLELRATSKAESRCQIPEGNQKAMGTCADRGSQK